MDTTGHGAGALRNAIPHDSAALERQLARHSGVILAGENSSARSVGPLLNLPVKRIMVRQEQIIDGHSMKQLEDTLAWRRS